LFCARLNQKHHQEGDNRGAGIDDELPGVRKAKNGPDMSHSTTIVTAAVTAALLPVYLVAFRKRSPTID
jgi:hypothetical protein